jgi:ribokinase
MVDLITYVDRVPHPGETLFASAFSQGFGGKGANQAAAVALHGLACSMVGCVGDDQFGPSTLADLAAYGVDTTHVTTIGGEVTGTAVILVEPSGENRIALGAGANRRVDAELVTAALHERGRDGLASPAVVVSQFETSQDAAIAAFGWARDAGATTVLTPGPPAALSPRLAPLCDWLVPNETELTSLLGLPPDHPIDDALRRAPAYASDLGVGLVVTLGPAGALVLGHGIVEQVAAPQVVAVDTTGAGDAFAGAFASALAVGLSPPAAARHAVAFASDSVTRPGTRASYARHVRFGDPAAPQA